MNLKKKKKSSPVINQTVTKVEKQVPYVDDSLSKPIKDDLANYRELTLPFDNPILPVFKKSLKKSNKRPEKKFLWRRLSLLYHKQRKAYKSPFQIAGSNFSLPSTLKLFYFDRMRDIVEYFQIKREQYKIKINIRLLNDEYDLYLMQLDKLQTAMQKASTLMDKLKLEDYIFVLFDKVYKTQKKLASLPTFKLFKDTILGRRMERTKQALRGKLFIIDKFFSYVETVKEHIQKYEDGILLAYVRMAQLESWKRFYLRI